MDAALLSAEGSVAGRFGPYGGRYVPETLVAALDDLTTLYDAVRTEPAFWAELDALLAEFVGRPSPLSVAPRLAAEVGAPVLLKREDLNHTGARSVKSHVVASVDIVWESLPKGPTMAETMMNPNVKRRTTAAPAMIMRNRTRPVAA